MIELGGDALGNHKGEWIPSANNNTRTIFENNTIPVANEIIDI